MASSETVGEFLIKMGIDADGVDRKVNDVVNNIGNSINNLVTGVLAPAMAGLASFDFVQSFADEITQVDRLSESLGVNIEQLSAWRTAAEMAGVEADEVGEIFADFNDWMVDAKFNEGGAMYTDFISKGLLPAVTDANGELKKTEDYILEFADALHKMDKAQASGIARQIGLSDLKTATWLQQGGDAIREQLNLAKEIGTFTEKDAAAAREYTFTMNMLAHSLKMAVLPVFRLLVPLFGKVADVMQAFTEKINTFFSSFKDMGVIGASISRQINLALSSLYKNIMAFAPLLAGVGLMKLIGIFKSMATAIKTASIVARAFILSPWGIVLTSLLAIGVAVQEFIKWLNGGDSALSSFFETLFGDTENAKNILDNVYNGFMDIVSKFEDNFSQLIPRFEELGQALLNLFNKIVDSEGFSLFVDVIISVIGFITTAIASFVNFLADNSNEIASIVDFIIGVFIGIVDVITYVVEAINSGISSAIEIFNTLGAVIEQIGNTISTIFNTMAGAFNSFVSAVSSGASSIIGSINEILGKLAELASNSLLGKILGSVGGSIYGALNNISNSIDNSTTTTNYDNKKISIQNIYPGVGNYLDPMQGARSY